MRDKVGVVSGSVTVNLNFFFWPRSRNFDPNTRSHSQALLLSSSEGIFHDSYGTTTNALAVCVCLFTVTAGMRLSVVSRDFTIRKSKCESQAIHVSSLFPLYFYLSIPFVASSCQL